MRATRQVLGLIIAGLLLALAGSSSASAGLVYHGTLSDWMARIHPVVNDDKDFMALDASPEMLVAAPDVSIAQVGLQYTVTISFGPGGVDGPFSGWIKYSVTITDPTRVFEGAAIDSTHLGSGNSLVRKDLDWGAPGVNASIVSLNGTTDTTLAAAGQVKLVITDYVTVDSSSNVASIANTFSQRVLAPEPGLLAILAGYGLIGQIRRRRSSWRSSELLSRRSLFQAR
ncbi:MAG: hypothetical protein ACKV0T_28570 [Planctomycetales bacterium]